ncbi:MAG: hypothetical protein ACQESD_04540 [Thermoplasmatota archaeon]
MRKKKSLIGLAFVVLALILLCLSVFLPWYSVHIKSESRGYYTDMNMEFDYYAYFDHWEVVTENNGNTNEDMDKYDDGSDIKGVFGLTRILAVIAIIATILGVVGLILLRDGKLDKKIVSIIIILAFIFSLLAPLYLMTSLPGALENQNVNYAGTGDDITEKFFGSDEASSDFYEYESDTKVRWGGDLSWFLVIAAAALNGIGAVTAFMMPGPEETGYRQMDQGYGGEGQQTPPPPPGQEQGYNTDVDEDQGMIEP